LHSSSPSELKARLEADRRGTPYLLYRPHEDEQRILELSPELERATIGRQEACDIALPEDPSVSRVHAVLDRIGEEWTLVDDGLSRNGSFVNGARVVGRRRLRDKDRLVFGATPITYRETSVGTTQTASAIDAPSGIPLSPMQRKVLIVLCRPVHDSASAIPATNRQIAEEVYLTVDAVKAHLRVLFERYGLSQLPQNEKRTRLVATVPDAGVLAPRDF
jgi:hypothetical protein